MSHHQKLQNIINFQKTKSIKIINLEPGSKPSISNSQIQEDSKDSFNDYIDDESGNMITCDDKMIARWKYREQVYIQKECIFGQFIQLYNCTKTFFAGIKKDNTCLHFIHT